MKAELHARATYADLILTALRRRPSAIAFVDAGRQITYDEVLDQTTRFAAAFDRLGLRRGDGVSILSTNRVEVFSFIAAALARGCRYTPLHPMGGIDDHIFILEEAQIKALCYEPRVFSARAREIAARKPPGLDLLLSFGPAEIGKDLLALAQTSPATSLETVGEESDLAWIAYTGGTTGRPKGVMLPHRSLVANAFLTLAEWELPREIRMLAVTPMSHGLLPVVLPVLLRGGTIHLEKHVDPGRMLEVIERERITLLMVVPTILYVLLDDERIRSTNLTSVETILYGGAPMSPSRLAQGIEVFGRVFMQLYAQTEAPNTVTVLRKEDHDPARPDLLASCGQPLAGLDVRLLGDDGREAAVGQIGEICVRGPLVMDGYWKNPDLTAEILRDGWLHTGDMARRDEEGYLYIVDRKKDMIISGGFNVYPREIEDVLSAHDGVALAAVIGVPDQKWGEAVKAVVVRRSGKDVEAEDLIRLVRERKGAVQAPKSIDFVDGVPLTAVGKVDKKALRARYWEGQTRSVH